MTRRKNKTRWIIGTYFEVGTPLFSCCLTSTKTGQCGRPTIGTTDQCRTHYGLTTKRER
jgi:hypothetical protein